MGLDTVTFWHWLAAGGALGVLGLLTSRSMFLWLGVAAVITGIALWTVPGLILEIQLGLFAVLAAVTAIAGRAVSGRRRWTPDPPPSDAPGAELVGGIYLLENATVDGYGTVCAGDAVWAVALRQHEGELSEGDLVKVTAVDGATLIVEPAADAIGHGG